MEKDNNMKKLIIVILIGIFVFWGLNNLELLIKVLKTILNVLFPFILGGVIAFILNVPMKKIESLLKKKIKKKWLVRAISIILSLLMFIAIILVVSFLLVPELVDNIKMLINNMPAFIDRIETFVVDLLKKYPEIQIQIEKLFTEKYNITDVVSNIIDHFANGTVGFIGNLVSGFAKFITSLIFAIYMLSQKEYLIRGCKKLLYANIDEKKADKIIDIGNLTNDTFSKFLTGQGLEAVILGCILFVALSIFRLPYAPLIAVLASVMALIPIFGAFVVAFVGFVLIAITSPAKAFLFLVIFVIIQQIEGNFIYPKVVGKKVGLSPIWTLLAVTVGGGLFGIVGMWISLPIASVLYTIIKNTTNKKLNEKNIIVK